MSPAETGRYETIFAGYGPGFPERDAADDDETARLVLPNSMYVNWVDPDMLAYNEANNLTVDHPGEEQKFRKFFEEGWLDPKYDHLRERWDPLIHDEEPQGRLMGKVALWNLVRCLELKERLDQ